MSTQGGKRSARIRLGLVLICSTLSTLSCGLFSGNLTICEVQGSGASSPQAGRSIRLEGTISAVLQQGETSGFYLEGECPRQGRSAGVRIAGDGALGQLQVGDRVRLQGLVSEQNFETLIQVRPDAIDLLSVGNPLVDPVALGELYRLDPHSFRYEDWEGQRVSLGESLLLAGGAGGGEALICPVFRRESFPVGSCGLDQAYYLRIEGGPGQTGLSSARPGARLSNLVGILGQGRDGYVLRALDLTRIRVRNQALAALDPGTGSSELGGTLPPGRADPEAPGSGTPEPTHPPEASPTFLPDPSPTWYPINLLLSEVLPNPEGKEPELEWVEIYNPEDYGIPLTGIKLGDEVAPDGREGALRFPDGYYIEAREVLVIAHSGQAFLAHYGFFPDFEMEVTDSRIPELLPYAGWGSSQIQFSNSGDELVLIDPWDELIDQVGWGKSTWSGFSPPAPAPPEGKSLERYPPERDRDLAEDWRIREGGSPGWLDRSPPTADAPQLLTPSATPTGSAPASPTATPSSTLTPTIPTKPSDTPRPAPSTTPSASQAPTSTPGSTVMPSPAPTILASQTPSLTPQKTASDNTTPLPDPTATPPPTAGLSPTNPLTCTTTPTPPASPSLSPTTSQTLTQSPTARPPGLIRFNEVHADPHPVLGDADGNGEVSSDDDEFLELVLLGGESLDLSGWVVADEVRPRFEFPDGTLLREGCALVLFGGEVDFPEIGGSLAFGSGSLGLNNSGDTVYLLDPSGEIITQLSYGPEAGQDQSLTRDPDLVGELPLVLHSAIPQAAGSLFSPGTRVDGAAFGDCP